MPGDDRRGYIRIDLANNCNIRCIMCQAYNSIPLSAMQFLDFDAFVAHTRGQLRKWQCIQLGNVAEPTIHPRFADFVQYIRSQAPDARVFVVTNGKLLHKFSDLLNSIGGCRVQISMDSVSKPLHEYIRAGSRFERALDNIALLDTSKVEVLLAFTLMASNVDEYPAMVEFCRQRSFHLSAFPMILRTEGGVLPLALLHESLWFQLAKLKRWLQSYYGPQYDLMIGSATGAMPYVTEFSCNAHYDDLNVDWNGNTNLCGKLTLPNLLTTPLDRVWNCADAQDFRLAVDNGRGPCVECDYRQRCLSPSMAVMANHFSEPIMKALSQETLQRIGFDRSMTDDEALWYFIQDVAEHLGVYDIRQFQAGFTARRVFSDETAPWLRYGEPLSAPSRHHLHSAMEAECGSDADPRLIEENVNGYNLVRYAGTYWALPTSLGPLHLGRERDRNKPGVLRARSLDELHTMCAVPSEHSAAIPRLVEQNRNGYNLVHYGGIYWALPLSLGHVDLTLERDRHKPGILRASSLEAARNLCLPGFDVSLSSLQ